MSVNTQTVQVDLNTGKIQAVVYAHQNDSNRSIVFEVFNNGAVFSLTGSTVKFGLKSPTVKGQYTVIAGSGMASGSVVGNKVTFEIPEEYTKIAGTGLLTMIITNSSKTIRPVNIKFEIHESADGDSVVAGASDFPSKMEEIVDAWMTGNVERYVDDTLSIPDMAAEAEATGEALAMKKLMVDDDDVLYLQDSFSASDQQIVQLAEVVGAWLEAHPEATTTVANNSITTAKIKDANVTEGKIQNGSISTEKIKDQSVTADKINSSFLSTIVNPTTPFLSLNEGIEITANTDLNSDLYVAPAVYSCGTTAKVGSLSNCPTQYPFVMIVRSETGSYDSDGKNNYLSREIYGIYNTRIWRQNISSDGNGVYTFGAWYRFDGSSYADLTASAQSLGAEGWQISSQYNTVRNGIVFIKLEAYYNGTVQSGSTWQSILEGFPKPDHNWYFQMITSGGTRTKIRVSTDGVLSVADSSGSSSYGIDTTISYPIAL